jgi:hypothetical protein
MTTSPSSSAKNRVKLPGTRKSAAKKPRTARPARTTKKAKTLHAKRAVRPTTAHRTSKAATKRAPASKTAKTKRWSKHVNETSDALDLEPGVFKKESASEIARSLKRSAEHSTRRKDGAFQSAMSMLTFYLNRGGKNLSEARRELLQRTKQRVREAFHRA